MQLDKLGLDNWVEWMKEKQSQSYRSTWGRRTLEKKRDDTGGRTFLSTYLMCSGIVFMAIR